MSLSVEFLPGPYTSDMSRTAAENAVSKHPAIQAGAAYALEQLDGRWIAAIVHEAGPFPPSPNGGGPDEEEESPAPKSEGPSGGDESPGGGDNDGDEGGAPDHPSDGDGDEGGSKHEKGGELHQLMDMMHQIMQALGIPMGMDGMVPGPGGPDAMTPPPAGPPHGPNGPAEQHVIHEKTMKPGEVPPGGTPIGAPAFASVRKDHPWAGMVGKVASFEVTDNIGDTPLGKISSELQTLSSEIGYRVARLREDRDTEGNRVAVAVITRH